MKYVEPIKSIVLTCLVLLSLVLTFMIWSYKPDYPFTEEPTTENVMIGQPKSKTEITKPYRMIYAKAGELRGETSSVAIDTVMKEFSQFSISTLRLETADLTSAMLDEMIRTPNRMTLFYQADIPINIFREILTFEDNTYPQATFNRVIVDWTNIDNTREVHISFVSTSEKIVHVTTVLATNIEAFKEIFIHQSEDFVAYSEIKREQAPSLYVTTEDIEATQYTYYGYEISPELLKSVLFEDAVVQKTIEGTQEKYTDSMSLLTLDTAAKNMNYVYPAAESSQQMDGYRLLTDTADFINEHGGFTADYRLSMMNLSNHVVEYQMYLQGYPVFSMDTLTRISAIWGDDRIFRYRRPYYSLNMDITTEMDTERLMAGTSVVSNIQQFSELELNEIDDLVIGYYLVQSNNSRLFVLEPSWFAINGNNWTRLTLDTVGGYAYGLE